MAHRKLTITLLRSGDVKYDFDLCDDVTLGRYEVIHPVDQVELLRAEGVDESGFQRVTNEPDRTFFLWPQRPQPTGYSTIAYVKRGKMTEREGGRLLLFEEQVPIFVTGSRRYGAGSFHLSVQAGKGARLLEGQRWPRLFTASCTLHIREHVALAR